MEHAHPVDVTYRYLPTLQTSGLENASSLPGALLARVPGVAYVGLPASQAPRVRLCVKLRRSTEDHGKVFINICHTKDIPAPEDISERRLMELWNANGETCDYRVPLSIGEGRQEPDKSGHPADVYDVAINTDFFGKVESSNMFRMFLMDVVMQGIEEKFHIELDKEDYVVMKNRKAMGNIPGHRVRVKDRREDAKPATPLIQELSTTRVAGTSASRPASTASSSTLPTPAPPSGAVRPEYRLLRVPATGPARSFVMQCHLPSVVSVKDVTLDVGEDRLCLSGGRSSKYFLDVFMPDTIIQNFTTAKFDKMSKILTVSMPISRGI
ncbi:PIH1 domain-containing protein 1 [Frankliniella fusca]|uniref:PIH1 domain-containing protein 1 n=1 Tax=Frankliniella fusca TaxID=407009 RepID=A0AAE1GTU7_9NEOP|nr:PIH1 domain-containing protein 1 [Frankliniella fusca]